MENLKQGGVDFILIETQITLKEIHSAFEAAKRLQIPVALTVCINDKLQLLSSESLEDTVSFLKNIIHYLSVQIVSVQLLKQGRSEN